MTTILGFMGSPRLNGMNSRLLANCLEGAQSRGAQIKTFELIKYNLMHCRSCYNCIHKKPELPLGECPLKDDVPAILKEYLRADGYVFACPNFDGYINALTKMFLERKIALIYRDEHDFGKIGMPRSPANFKKKASIIITGNSADEYREVMGDPCFEAIEAHLMIEQVETVDKFFVGGVENLPASVLEERLAEARRMGVRLVEEIEKAQQEE